jgi:tripeptidyl-peptidase-1
MTNLPRVPQTISVPYFTGEPDIPEEYATSLCLLFGQLGTSGASVLVASGDDGVGRGSCKDSTDSSGNIQFYTAFPASCTCDV